MECNKRSEYVPTYFHKEVANVCLNCPRLSCEHGGGAKGCQAYREAVNKVSIPKRRGRRKRM